MWWVCVQLWRKQKSCNSWPAEAGKDERFRQPLLIQLMMSHHSVQYTPMTSPCGARQASHGGRLNWTAEGSFPHAPSEVLLSSAKSFPPSPPLSYTSAPQRHSARCCCCCDVTLKGQALPVGPQACWTCESLRRDHEFHEFHTVTSRNSQEQLLFVFLFFFSQVHRKKNKNEPSYPNDKTGDLSKTHKFPAASCVGWHQQRSDYISGIKKKERRRKNHHFLSKWLFTWLMDLLRKENLIPCSKITKHAHLVWMLLIIM